MARRIIAEELKRAVVAAYNSNQAIEQIAEEYGVADSSIYRWSIDPRYNADLPEELVNGHTEPVKITRITTNPNDDAQFQAVINFRGDHLRKIIGDPNITIIEITRRPKDAM